MQNIRNLLFILLGFLLISCTRPADAVDSPQDLLRSFRLEMDGKQYHATIDYDTGKTVITGIRYGAAVTGVQYELAQGATITPNPLSFVRNWPASQVFTVTKEGTSEDYEVILEDYAADQTIDQVVFGYVQPADWNFDLCIDKVDWTNITHMLLSFAYVKADGTLDTATLDKFIQQLIDKARANGVKPVISIRSTGVFSDAIATEELRETLAGNIVAYAQKYGLDGIDIDYEEYETVAANLDKLQDLFSKVREKMDDDMIFTCAIIGSGWVEYGPHWHTYFDYVNIMSYDALNGKDTPQQHSSYDKFVSDIENCHEQFGMPYSKLVGGVPFYGYSWDNLPGTDNALGITFRSIMDYYRDKNPDAKNLDHIGNTYYNGQGTIRRKCEYAKKNNLGGVMIWQLFQDSMEPDESLLNVVGDVMIEE